ncbi:hypothetical protein TRL7639_04504 [Falsiruegeria litorea R37]|uniref:DUF2793 domain-containing protein n=1 Tax=Falsiruegeria litorea R37 TaxID=1200284 RepID=A0A1Y5TVX7_9RHOB|nr:DUF2793 domain-containing protein [Falsiruegeria litorea]SLN74187.1 hypothetical protein TRL7639_04504 [Falsiruegeria litorea R37]
MPVSPNLSLPYIQPSQAQKHVTHNEGMRRLDALVQLSVTSASITTPPATPDDGARYILPIGADGAWSGHSRELAVFEDTSWAFYPAEGGWIAWDEDAQELLAFDGTDWVKAVSPPDFQNLTQVGVGTTADAGNPLAVSGPATLLSHAGAGHQLKLNKAAAADTASLLFQTNWSGRAEMGTTGSDDFEIKVSGDGTTFKQAIVADKDTGTVSFPSGASGLAPSEFGSGALLTTNYMIAKGDGLVANGTCLLGNAYNFPSAFSYDATTSPNLPASVQFKGHHAGPATMSELVAVDPNQVYRLNSYLRQESVSGDWSAFANGERHAQYMGLICLDADRNIIYSNNHMRYKHGGVDSLTTLAAPLTPGDTTVQLTNAAGWNESQSPAYYRGLIIFGYKNSGGYTYPYYSRVLATDLFDLGQINKSTNVITLNKPLPASMGNPDHASGTWPAGTRLANCSSGSTYKYAFYNGLHVPQTDKWYHTTGYIGGIDTSGTNAALNFAPGTVYAQPFWLPNQTNVSGGISGYPDTGANHKVWFAGISVAADPLATQQAITSGVTSGVKELKVPQPNHTAGTITLVAATQSIKEA